MRIEEILRPEDSGESTIIQKKGDTVLKEKWRAVMSSKFVSYKVQLNAMNEALTRESRNMPRFTGEDCKGNLVVRMEFKKVGVGYEPNPLDHQNPRFIPEMNAFEMRFDFATLRPITIYPVEKI